MIIDILVVLVLIVLFCFTVVLLVGAPYLPTLKPQVNLAIELASLKPGETLLELGCGDGRLLIAAANKGINSIGYELNPILVLIARLRTIRYRKRVRVIWGDFWYAKWPPSDVIFVFLLDRYMIKLNNKCMQYPYRPVKLVSFAFRMPNKKPDKETKGLFLYNYE